MLGFYNVVATWTQDFISCFVGSVGAYNLMEIGMPSSKSIIKVLTLALIISWGVLYLDNLAEGKKFCDEPHPKGSILSLFCPVAVPSPK